MNIDLVLDIEPKPQRRTSFNRRTGRAYEVPEMRVWRRQCTALIADELLIDGRVTDSQLVWKDDGQVAELHAIKAYSMRPRIEVDVRNVEND